MDGMIAKISPVSPEWVHEFVMQPYLEGAERLNRAWQGANIHSLNRTVLSLKERVISALIGIALMLPLINTIIWIAWQTFGKPERLSDPYSPEMEIAPPPFLPRLPLQPPTAQTAPKAGGIEFSFREGEMQANWTIESSPESTVVREHCDEYFSISRYNPDATIYEFTYQQNSPEPRILRLLRSAPA
jgi:hypothetical protein